MSRLDLSDVSVSYDGVPAVVDVALTVPEGEVLAVLGPSGCGKSTLLRAVAGLEQLTSGSIHLDGHDLAGVPTHRRGFALMFQDGQLFAHLTVAGNVGYPLHRRRPRVAARRVAERVEELLTLVGLAGYADRMPATLSGGERQRVALARSLAAEPRLLLLDEPLSALDTGLRERLALELRDVLRRAGTTALMVTHDHEEAFTVAHRLAVMRSGRVVQHGPIDDVWRSPVDAETALFLGYAHVLEGAAARALLVAAGLPPAADAVALRRSALSLIGPAGPAGPEHSDHTREAVSGEGHLVGTVLSSRLTPEQVRLVVDVDRLGVLDAVARLDAHPAAGARVTLRVDPTRLAALPGGGPGSRP